MPARIEKVGDLWADLLTQGQTLASAIESLRETPEKIEQNRGRPGRGNRLLTAARLSPQST